jgi:Ulp1 protease family, C-terminal catalytic domain
MLDHRDKILCLNDKDRLPSFFADAIFMQLLVENMEKKSEKALEDVVKRVTRYIDVFSCDKMFVPTNINNNHWTMTIVNFPMREIHYYDSLSGLGQKYTDALIIWLASESMSNCIRHQRMEHHFSRASCTSANRQWNRVRSILHDVRRFLAKKSSIGL